MSEEAPEPVADHGKPGRPMAPDGGDCEAVLARFGRSGIDVGALAIRTRNKGASKFDKSWNDLMVNVEARRAKLGTGGVTG